MSSFNNISLFIPHVFPNFSKEYVAKAFDHFGRVDHVDFVAKQDRDGKQYNAAYVHIYWDNNQRSQDFIDRVMDPNREARVYHDGPWYWIVLPNNAKKHVSGDRKPRIDLGDAKVINSSNFVTPEKQVALLPKPVLRRGVAIRESDSVGAPVKSYAQVVKEIGDACGWSETQRQFLFDLENSKNDIETPLTIGPNDYAKSFVDPTEDAALDKEAEEMLAQMDEIESELEVEDANLVSIDGRYVQSLETENSWLTVEVAQLRAALINMDYLYQAEAAKVRALSLMCDHDGESKKNV